MSEQNYSSNKSNYYFKSMTDNKQPTSLSRNNSETEGIKCRPFTLE